MRRGDVSAVDEGLGSFCLDRDVLRDPRGRAVARVQARLAATLNGSGKTSLFERQYSLIANPWSAITRTRTGGWSRCWLRRTHRRKRHAWRCAAWLKLSSFSSRIRIAVGTRQHAAVYREHSYGDHPDEAWQRWGTSGHGGLGTGVRARGTGIWAFTIKFTGGRGRRHGRLASSSRHRHPWRPPRHRWLRVIFRRPPPPRSLPAARPMTAAATPCSNGIRSRVPGASRALIAGYAPAGRAVTCASVSALRPSNATPWCATRYKPASVRCPMAELTESRRGRCAEDCRARRLLRGQRTERGLPAVFPQSVAANGRACVDARRWGAASSAAVDHRA